MNRRNRSADQEKKLFIGGLSARTDENSLRTFYGQWGEITDAVVMKDPQTGRSRGFGFVTYKTTESVDLAQANRPHTVDSKVVDSKRAMPKEETSPEIQVACKRIFVGGLRRDISSADLSTYFGNYGPITEATIVTSKETGESRGFGFVTFVDSDAVDKVILARPHTINDSRADVKKALSKEEMGIAKARPMRGGMGGGPPPAPAPTWTSGVANMGYQQAMPQQQQSAWDMNAGYNANYAAQSYNYNGAVAAAGGYGGYGAAAGGYQMDPSRAAMMSQGGAPAAAAWNQVQTMDPSQFGSYPQQPSYGGGPMRAPVANQYGQRPAPYGTQPGGPAGY